MIMLMKLKLSLWIAQHQMNSLYEEILDERRAFLPLAPSEIFIAKMQI